jgi:RsiW-degrading membrane proteinase PrsW (M82 family)
MLQYLDMWFLDSLHPLSLPRLLTVLVVVGVCAGIDLRMRSRGRRLKLLPGCVLGSVLSLAIIQIATLFAGPEAVESPYAMALALIALFLAWKALFGPWDPAMKAAVLGTFLFWIAFHILAQQEPAARTIHLISMALALVPAAVWCGLFLKYHAERASTILLMFFSGMLSTVPILFYDLLVRGGAKFQFFLFTITPESFSRSSHSFVSGQLALGGGVQSLVWTTLVSFLIVGVIEELSKYWVLNHSGRTAFRSIDDALEMAILVAIGFAFAENVVNPVYFGGFVREYLMNTGSPDVLGFLSNMLGRSILTSMVHILSTGVIGYFLGLAVFAEPYLVEQRSHGKKFAWLTRLEAIFQVKQILIFRILMISAGIAIGVLLHAGFNFMVTLPDILPSHPETLGDLFGISMPLLQKIPLLIFPSMLYVVGGFWLLTSLFLRRENMEDRGHPVVTEVFVRD